MEQTPRHRPWTVAYGKRKLRPGKYEHLRVEMPGDEDLAVATRGVAGELAKLQESCDRTVLKIRWVNGDAQLANSLTKSHEQAQLNLFYKLGGRWRLVYDETYTSARKRRLAGTTALEDAPLMVPEALLDEDSESSEDNST